MINRISIFIFLSVFFFLGCKKEENYESNSFILESPDVSEDGLLPVDYTCDGEAATLPLEWHGFPEGTKSFALLMHHEASPKDVHWYWIIYNIPVTVQSLSRNVTGVGTLGTNSVNDRAEYAPPCSQGPGEKVYVYTIYALSDELDFSVPPTEVDMEVFLNTIKEIKLDSASLIVSYSRDI
jgi:Raf kinase inhibitor-like YbhB/YbcL family protein